MKKFYFLMFYFVTGIVLAQTATPTPPYWDQQLMKDKTGWEILQKLGGGSGTPVPTATPNANLYTTTYAASPTPGTNVNAFIQNQIPTPQGGAAGTAYFASPTPGVNVNAFIQNQVPTPSSGYASQALQNTMLTPVANISTNTNALVAPTPTVQVKAYQSGTWQVNFTATPQVQVAGDAAGNTSVAVRLYDPSAGNVIQSTTVGGKTGLNMFVFQNGSNTPVGGGNPSDSITNSQNPLGTLNFNELYGAGNVWERMRGVDAIPNTSTGIGIMAGAPYDRAVTQLLAAQGHNTFSPVASDEYGRPLNNLFGGPRASLTYVTSGSINASTTPVTVIAKVSSTYNDITNLTVSNSGTAQCVLSLKTNTTTVNSVCLAPGGGTYTFTNIPELTANQDWSITSDTSTGVTINYSGYYHAHP